MIKIDAVILKITVDSLCFSDYMQANLSRMKTRVDANVERISREKEGNEYQDFPTAMEDIDGTEPYKDDIWRDRKTWKETNIGNCKLLLSGPFPCDNDGNTLLGDKLNQFYQDKIDAHAGFWIIEYRGEPWSHGDG